MVNIVIRHKGMQYDMFLVYRLKVVKLILVETLFVHGPNTFL